MVCNVPATVDQIIQRLCPSGVLPQSAFGGNRRCRRCAWLQGDAIFSTLRDRSGRRPAGSLNATQLIRLISIEAPQNNGPHGGDRVWRSRDGWRVLPPAPSLLRVRSRAVNTDQEGSHVPSRKRSPRRTQHATFAALRSSTALNVALTPVSPVARALRKHHIVDSPHR
jgi:hypothetical protein